MVPMISIEFSVMSHGLSGALGDSQELSGPKGLSEGSQGLSKGSSGS